MIAAIVAIDRRRPAELGHDDDQCACQHAALVQIVEQGGEGPIELAELFDVEVEILVMRVVVGVR